MPTTFQQFWDIYTLRSRADRWVRPDLLWNHPTVTAFCQYPVAVLQVSTPRAMRRCLQPLEEQLRGWLQELKCSDATATAVTDVRRHPASPRTMPHSLMYWNSDEPNGGLRHWG